MEQIKADYADCSDKLQYAEQLLEKAKADFRDKNSRIKALEAHLDESRNEISRLTRQLDYIKEESDRFQEELKHAYELHREPSRTRCAPPSPLPSRTGSPVPGLTHEQKVEGVVLKQSPTPSEELYLMTKPWQKNLLQPAADRRTAAWTKKTLTSSPGTLTISPPACQIAKMSKLISRISISIWKFDLTLPTKIDSYLHRTTSSPEVRSFLNRQPAHTKTDYQLLREALVKHFADPESEQGLVAALETRQGRHEPPQACFSRLRWPYL